jgi:hypothetical protein
MQEQEKPVSAQLARRSYGVSVVKKDDKLATASSSQEDSKIKDVSKSKRSLFLRLRNKDKKVEKADQKETTIDKSTKAEVDNSEISWMVRRGDEINGSHVKTHHFSVNVGDVTVFQRGDKAFEVHIYESRDYEPINDGKTRLGTHENYEF